MAVCGMAMCGSAVPSLSPPHFLALPPLPPPGITTTTDLTQDYTLGEHGCVIPHAAPPPSLLRTLCMPRLLPARLHPLRLLRPVARPYLFPPLPPLLPRAAQYKPDTFEGLAHRQTVDKLVKAFGYPQVRCLSCCVAPAAAGAAAAWQRTCLLLLRLGPVHGCCNSIYSMQSFE